MHKYTNKYITSLHDSFDVYIESITVNKINGFIQCLECLI